MSPELEKRLVSEFPDLFVDYDKSSRESCMAWGCEHSDGWFNIILSLCRSISWHIKHSKEKIDFKFTQVKEKFAGLRVYTHGGDDYIKGIIAMAETMSLLTCEVSGKGGQMCKKGHWYRTLSREQALIDGYVVCGDNKEEEVEAD